MKTTLSIYSILILFTLNTYCQAQKHPEHIRDWDEDDVKDYCWNNNDERFKENTYSSTEDSSSAIFLHYMDLFETKYTYYNNVGISYIGHRRIKLLDAAAVKQYSEIYYSNSSHGSYRISSHVRKKDYLGIRVIKPDGSKKIMENSKFITDKDDKKKLAVSNLEVGDIIDYYIYTYDYLEGSGDYKNWYAIINKFTLEGKYPIKHFDYKIITDKNWKVRIFASDSIPIKESILDDHKHYYSFNISTDDIKPSKSRYWHYAYQSSPYIKTYLSCHPHHLIKRQEKKMDTLRTSCLTSKDILNKYKTYYAKNKQARNEYNGFESYLKENNKLNLNNEEILEEYYYYIRHHFINKHYLYDRFNDNEPRNITPISFTGHIIYGLDKLDIPYDIIVVAPRKQGRITEVTDIDETDYLIRVKLDKPIYFYKPTPYTMFNSFPGSIEASEGYVVQSPDNKAKNLKVEKITLPSSNYKENIVNYNFDISFNKEEQNILDSKANITYHGHQMINQKYYLTNVADMIWNENKHYRTKEWGALDKITGTHKIKMEEFYETLKKDREDNFTQLANDAFDIEIEEVENIMTHHTGNMIGDNKLEVSFDCKLEGLVKKVGPNYILSAGKLVGGQITLEDEDMKRDVDIYMKFARGYDYTVNITIPEGYEAKGLDKFLIDIDNETGQTKSSATLHNNIITLRFEKYYKSNYVKAENWDKMKDFLIPASQFLNKEILLKKKM